MEPSKKNFEINPDEKGQYPGKIEIWEGINNTPKEIAPMTVEGNIMAAHDFYTALTKREKLQAKAGDSHLIVDKELGTITLLWMERDPYQKITVKGSLSHDKDFNVFQINKGKGYGTKEIARLIRRNKRIIEDKNKAEELADAFTTFKATVDVAMEQSGDERTGSFHRAFKKVVNSGLPKEFDISINLWKGGKTHNLSLYHEIEEANNQFTVFICCDDLDDIMELERDELMDKCLKVFKEDGFAIIYK